MGGLTLCDLPCPWGWPEQELLVALVGEHTGRASPFAGLFLESRCFGSLLQVERGFEAARADVGLPGLSGQLQKGAKPLLWGLLGPESGWAFTLPAHSSTQVWASACTQGRPSLLAAPFMKEQRHQAMQSVTGVCEEKLLGCIACSLMGR